MIIIDTETGGLDPRRHALVEVGALHVETGAEFHRIVKPYPSYEMEPEALRKNGYTPEILMEIGTEEAEVVVDFAKWMLSHPVQDWAGSNPGFDRDFIHAAMERHGMAYRLPRRPVGVENLAWMADQMGVIVLPVGKDGRKSAGLDSVLKALGMEDRGDNPHDALGDCRLTRDVLQKLLALVTVRKEAA